MNGIYHLQGTVKHYDWGGKDYIPALLQLPNPGQIPFAEYWLGMHALGESSIKVNDGESRPVSLFIDKLPYLLKLLDVHSMLSIQVHPDKASAAAAYVKENEAGIPKDSPNRNYKDDNHKPEMMVALGDFWLLHGFKEPVKLASILQRTPELRELIPLFGEADYKSLYTHIMEMPQAKVNQVLTPLVERVKREKSRNQSLFNEDYWAAMAAETFPGPDYDRGIFSIYLFNVVHLKKGEGVFQAAGLPHAYLRGQNVEIMANSDNVLRGGLTTKHIDVPELLKHVRCEPTIPNVIIPRPGTVENNYYAPVPDFSLTGYRISKDQPASFVSNGIEILVVTSGMAYVKTGDTELHLGAGQPAACIFPGQQVTLKTKGEAVIFRAGEPVHNG